MLQLVVPSADYQASYLSYIAELGDEERYPFPLDFEHSDFPAMLARIAAFRLGEDIPQGYVPSSTFWLIRDGEIVGCTNVRHFLNAQIEHCGGHIGLSIRPSARGHGLGVHLMQLSIAEARRLGNNCVHIHCHAHNSASRALIVASGGVLHSDVVVDGEQVLRFRVG
ncbi:GNAT family N-acetyltransferase [Pseudidiomarina woesei]|uniref:Predicted acetyltransferase n=1 Tax=Pseudidiomarina woesei TaxID=1381080 RepID=A0A0K6H1V5_9GAMM|nr:GNAT family N-acetyltransferase [Pseudidiomarina woesei]CUA84870.1 Predicted acetyltransferase [Pseudidiomarina woesei]